MTIPRTLTLRNTAAGLRLCSWPAEELSSLHGRQYGLQHVRISNPTDLTAMMHCDKAIMDLDLQLDLGDKPAGNFSIILSNTKGERYVITYDRTLNTFSFDRSHSGNTGFSSQFCATPTRAPRISKGNEMHLRMIMDVASCEFFAEDGETVVTEIYFPSTPFTSIQIVPESGDLLLNSATAFELKATKQQ